MKNTIIKAIVALLFLGAFVGGFVLWHKWEMNSAQSELTAQINKENQVKKELEEVISKLKTENVELTDNNNSLSGKISVLTSKIDDLLTKDVVVFDAGKVKDEIRNIGELASIEYYYQNVGVLDANKQFSFWNHNIPFSGKKAVIKMDGMIKAGIDMSTVKVEYDESASKIIVSHSPAIILSNELDEDTFQSIVEDESIINQLTSEDHNELRRQIKEVAVENAEKSKVLVLAEERARQLIQNVLEAIPNVKENCKIEFKKVS